ncbi:hypothetical protein KLK06_57475 [Nonomuraea sp. NEAU-A123]|nr:hypothetical protein [Nonomuraea sp. NEAU-A123]
MAGDQPGPRLRPAAHVRHNGNPPRTGRCSAAVDQLRAQGVPVKDKGAARLSHAHINFLGRYAITASAPAQGLRQLGEVPLDLLPQTVDGQAAEVARLEVLGATLADVGQGDVSWTVLADPEGNEFCVLGPA